MKNIALMIGLVVVLLLSACSNSQTVEGNTTSTAGPSPTEHNHTAMELRNADNFICQNMETDDACEYMILYREPDGCLSEVASVGEHDQPIVVYNGKIYYQDENCVIAVTYSGDVVSKINIPGKNERGWLLHCDGEYIYGAASQTGTGDAGYCFAVNLDLTEIKELSALPAKYRELSYERLLDDFEKVAKCNRLETYVHAANIEYDTNGMIKEMLLQISVNHEGEIQTGNLLFAWYNQHRDYKEGQMNPWYNESEETYADQEAAIRLDVFFGYLTRIQEENLVLSNLPQTEKLYRLNFNKGVSDGSATHSGTKRNYVSLMDGTVVDETNNLQNCFEIETRRYHSTEEGENKVFVDSILYVVLPNNS